MGICNDDDRCRRGAAPAPPGFDLRYRACWATSAWRGWPPTATSAPSPRSTGATDRSSIATAPRSSATRRTRPTHYRTRWSRGARPARRAAEIALKPWLYRVAHNEAISLLRQRRPGVELDPDRLTVPAADADAATIERLRQLVDDLGQLPDRQRGAFVMRELSGLSSRRSPPASTARRRRPASSSTRPDSRCRRWLRVARWSATESARRSPSATAACLRGRRLRAHLRDCERCANFRAGIVDRREDLAQLAPALALPVALGLTKGLAGGGGAAGGGGGRPAARA